AAKQSDQQREADEPEELGTIGPRETRQRDRGDRRGDGDDRSPRPARYRGRDDGADEQRDSKHADRKYPARASEGVARGEKRVAKPLIGEDRPTRDRPREDVLARKRQIERRLPTGDVPEQIAVIHRLERRERTERGREHERDRRNAHQGCDSNTQFGPFSVTCQPSSRSAPTR